MQHKKVIAYTFSLVVGVDIKIVILDPADSNYIYKDDSQTWYSGSSIFRVTIYSLFIINISVYDRGI